MDIETEIPFDFQLDYELFSRLAWVCFFITTIICLRIVLHGSKKRRSDRERRVAHSGPYEATTPQKFEGGPPNAAVVSRTMKERGEVPPLLLRLWWALTLKQGASFEQRVAYVLRRSTLCQAVQVWTNVLVPNGDGTAECDVIALINRHLIVCECKDLSGWIFGERVNKYWKQTFGRGRKQSFYNPQKQNDTHVRALGNALGYEGNLIVNVVVFSDRCTLKAVPIDNAIRKVCHLSELSEVCAAMVRDPNVIAECRYEEIVEKIDALKAASTPWALRKHARRVAQYKK